MGLPSLAPIARWLMLEALEAINPRLKNLSSLERLRMIRDAQPKPRCDICGSVTKVQRDERCKGACR